MPTIDNLCAYDRSELGGYQMRLRSVAKKMIEQSGVGAATGFPICWNHRDRDREPGVAPRKSGISYRIFEFAVACSVLFWVIRDEKHGYYLGEP